MQNVEVAIFGKKYMVRGEANSEYIMQLAELVDSKIREVAEASPNLSPLKTAILASLNIADELAKTKEQYLSISQGIKKIEDKADTILELCD